MFIHNFIDYDSLPQCEIANYENEIINSDKFFKNYDSWKQGDQVYQEYVVDPIFLAVVERSLGRQLTIEEKLGESPIYRLGSIYIDYFNSQADIVEIPMVSFPYGV